MPKRGYDQGHGDDGGVLQPDEEPARARSAEARASLVPSIEELSELNRRIHEDDGISGAFALDQRAPLLGCLEEVRAVDTASPEGVAKAAALLAHGIAQAQSFRDGNRRTAYISTQAFLDRHKLGYLSAGTKSTDHMLVRLLNQVVERQKWFNLRTPPGPEKFEKLFLRRLANRTPPAATGEAGDEGVARDEN